MSNKRNNDLKRAVRARMAATGENYTTARRWLLAQRQRPLLDYNQPETALGLLEDRGYKAPDRDRALSAIAAFLTQNPGPRYDIDADRDAEGSSWDKTGGPWADRLEDQLLSEAVIVAAWETPPVVLAICHPDHADYLTDGDVQVLDIDLGPVFQKLSDAEQQAWVRRQLARVALLGPDSPVRQDLLALCQKLLGSSSPLPEPAADETSLDPDRPALLVIRDPDEWPDFVRDGVFRTISIELNQSPAEMAGALGADAAWQQTARWRAEVKDLAPESPVRRAVEALAEEAGEHIAAARQSAGPQRIPDTHDDDGEPKCVCAVRMGETLWLTVAELMDSEIAGPEWSWITLSEIAECGFGIDTDEEEWSGDKNEVARQMRAYWASHPEMHEGEEFAPPPAPNDYQLAREALEALERFGGDQAYESVRIDDAVAVMAFECAEESSLGSGQVNDFLTTTVLETLRVTAEALMDELEAVGGRGVELAERIDRLHEQIEQIEQAHPECLVD